MADVSPLSEMTKEKYIVHHQKASFILADSPAYCIVYVLKHKNLYCVFIQPCNTIFQFGTSA